MNNGLFASVECCGLTPLIHSCPTTVNEIREGYQRYKHVSLTAPWIPNALSKNKDPFYVEKMIAGFDEGTAVEVADDNILNLNYLQVRYAERQVYCERDSFWLVKDMLAKDSSYRTGPRMRSN